MTESNGGTSHSRLWDVLLEAAALLLFQAFGLSPARKK